jgi:hypothetical protein
MLNALNESALDVIPKDSINTALVSLPEVRVNNIYYL